MAKKRNKGRPAPPVSAKNSINSPSRWSRVTKILLGAISTTGIIAGLPGLASYYVHVSVTPTTSVREREAMGTVFQLSNPSSFLISDVKYACITETLHDPVHGMNFSGNTSVPNGAATFDLGPGGSADLDCDREIVGVQDLEGGFAVEVSYKPLFWCRKTERFRFHTIKTDDGKWVWKRTLAMN